MTAFTIRQNEPAPPALWVAEFEPAAATALSSDFVR